MREERAKTVAAILGELGETEVGREMARGQAMTTEEATAVAMRDPTSVR